MKQVIFFQATNIYTMEKQVNNFVGLNPGVVIGVSYTIAAVGGTVVYSVAIMLNTEDYKAR